jgi:hypothetical protein
LPIGIPTWTVASVVGSRIGFSDYCSPTNGPLNPTATDPEVAESERALTQGVVNAMKYSITRIVLICGCAGVGFSAGEARAGAGEPIYMVNSPTAGLLSHGEYHIQGRLGPASSILLGLRVGVKDRVHLGVSFGMQEVFSYEKIEINDRVGFQFRFRLLGEDDRRPGLALGFNSQGDGAWSEEYKRYDRKSKGLYAVVSRNWKIPVGYVSLHGGVNYSFEDDDDNDPNAFAAVDWEAIAGLEFILDFDGAINDNVDDARYGGGGIYLDGAIRVTYGENLQMMLIFKDLTENFTEVQRIGREFEIAFFEFF